MASDQIALVPPRRLGTLLRQARVSAGVDLVELSKGTEFGVVVLEDIEAGRSRIDDSSLAKLLKIYGIEDSGLVPARSRLVIDLDEGRIAVDEADITVGETDGADAVLTRYLSLVYRLRELPLGTSIQLREVDLGVLATALSIESSDVEVRLERLMLQKSVVRRDQKRLRHRLLVPLAGVMVAATAAGVLIIVSQDSSVPDPVTTQNVATQISTDLGTGAAVVTNGGVQVTTDIGNGGAVETNNGG